MDFPLLADLSCGNLPFLPTKERIEHILVRLHGAAALLVHLLTACGLSYAKQESKLRIGHFWNTALGYAAAIARIW